ncbi:MAG: hypothetical protein QM756_23320 [Polyangiaceae bacterium]
MRAEDRSKQMLRALLQRIDAVLDETPSTPPCEVEADDASAAPPPAP